MRQGFEIFGTVLVAGMVVGLLAWIVALRHKGLVLKHQERLLALEKGLPIPAEPVRIPEPFSPRIYLLRGLCWLFTGLSISVILACLSLSIDRTVPKSVQLREITRMRDMGATEEELKDYRAHPEQNKGVPLGLASLGLLPAGVGLAYLIYYRRENAAEI